jgi:hypothetical protein
VEYGLAPVIYYQNIPTKDEFMEWLRTGNNNLVVMLDEDKVVGAGFVNDAKYQKDGKWRCEVGFVCFPGLSPFKAVRLGKMAFDLIIQELGYDYFYGTTPACNPKAIQYARLLGMQYIATIPNLVAYNGVTTDAVISYVDKSSYPLS